jgi:hypothetical protein
VDAEPLAQIYAANYLTKNDVEWVAEEIYGIMENSIANDSIIKQETTKEFLVRVIQIIHKVDKEYCAQITKVYLNKTLNTLYGNLSKKGKNEK